MAPDGVLCPKPQWGSGGEAAKNSNFALEISGHGKDYMQVSTNIFSFVTNSATIS